MLHRPYIRQSVRQEVESRAMKNEKGQFLDANTGKAIEGKYDLGHVRGYEHWREAEKAEKSGMTQEQFNEHMNNPDYYQIEDPHENRSHAHEMPKGVDEDNSNANQIDDGIGKDNGNQIDADATGTGQDNGEEEGEENSLSM